MSSIRLARAAGIASATVLPALAVLQAAPVISTFGPLRNAAMPRLSGQGRPDHIALTFDDGPDHLATPHFLRFLDTRGIRATFFLLGSMLARSPGLAQEMAAAGHEIAAHCRRVVHVPPTTTSHVPGTPLPKSPVGRLHSSGLPTG